MLYRVNAQVGRRGITGSWLLAQLPTFFIDAKVSGVKSIAGVERVVRQMLYDVNPGCMIQLTVQDEPIDGQ